MKRANKSLAQRGDDCLSEFHLTTKNQKIKQMKRYLIIALVLVAQIAAAQIGSNKETILTYERSKGSELGAFDGNKLHAVNKNVNTYYYLKNGRCTNIVKITRREDLGSLKQFLSDNGYKYDTSLSVYRKDNLVGEFEYQNQFIYLKINEQAELVLK